MMSPPPVFLDWFILYCFFLYCFSLWVLEVRSISLLLLSTFTGMSSSSLPMGFLWVYYMHLLGANGLHTPPLPWMCPSRSKVPLLFSKEPFWFPKCFRSRFELKQLAIWLVVRLTILVGDPSTVEYIHFSLSSFLGSWSEVKFYGILLSALPVKSRHLHPYRHSHSTFSFKVSLRTSEVLGFLCWFACIWLCIFLVFVVGFFVTAVCSSLLYLEKNFSVAHQP